MFVGPDKRGRKEGLHRLWGLTRKIPEGTFLFALTFCHPRRRKSKGPRRKGKKIPRGDEIGKLSSTSARKKKELCKKRSTPVSRIRRICICKKKRKSLRQQQQQQPWRRLATRASITASSTTRSRWTPSSHTKVGLIAKTVFIPSELGKE